MLKPFVSCLLLVFPVSLCQAQEATDSGKTIFEALDKNNDGFLTRDELGPEKEDLFNRLLTISDRDEDGTLTREEFLKGASPKPPTNPTPMRGQVQPGGRGQFPEPQQMFERFDRNRDGQLTSEEMPEPIRERFAPVFESLGKDSLNVEEFKTALSILREDSPPQQRRMPNEDQFFSRLDENQDGKVTIEEVPVTIREQVKPLFDQLGKTAITREDFQKLRVSRDRGPLERRAADGRPAMQRPEGEFVPRGPRFFIMLDSDRDGLLSADELSQASGLVDKLDRDQNGKLDPGELMGFGGRGMGGPEGRPGMRGPGASDRPDRPRRPEMAGGATPPAQENRPAPPNLRTAPNDEFAKRFLERFDRDQDGFLSQEEAPERMRGNFERLDSDGDGRVSAEEMTAALKRRSREVP